MSGCHSFSYSKRTKRHTTHRHVRFNNVEFRLICSSRCVCLRDDRCQRRDENGVQTHAKRNREQVNPHLNGSLRLDDCEHVSHRQYRGYSRVRTHSEEQGAGAYPPKLWQAFGSLHGRKTTTTEPKAASDMMKRENTLQPDPQTQLKCWPAGTPPCSRARRERPSCR